MEERKKSFQLVLATFMTYTYTNVEVGAVARWSVRLAWYSKAVGLNLGCINLSLSLFIQIIQEMGENTVKFAKNLKA